MGTRWACLPILQAKQALSKSFPFIFPPLSFFSSLCQQYKSSSRYTSNVKYFSIVLSSRAHFSSIFSLCSLIFILWPIHLGSILGRSGGRQMREWWAGLTVTLPLGNPPDIWLVEGQPQIEKNIFLEWVQQKFMLDWEESKVQETDARIPEIIVNIKLGMEKKTNKNIKTCESKCNLEIIQSNTSVLWIGKRNLKKMSKAT